MIAGSRVTTMYGVGWVPTVIVLSNNGTAVGGWEVMRAGPTEEKATEQKVSAAVDTAIAQVVTTTSQTSTTGQNPIPGFSIESIVLGLTAVVV